MTEYGSLLLVAFRCLAMPSLPRGPESGGGLRGGHRGARGSQESGLSGAYGIIRGAGGMTGRGRTAGPDLRVTGVEPVTRSSVQRVLDVLPFLIMGAVAAASVVFGPRSGLLQLLALGPAFAAVSGGLRTTIGAGVVALVLAADQVISMWGDYARDSATVVGVTIAAVIACTVRQRREHELAEVRAIAEVAQQVLLGPVPYVARSVRLAVRYMSATSHARIGGGPD